MANRSDILGSSSLYRTQYLKAVKLFDEDNFEECIEAARYNLTNNALPHHYRMKNLLLIAGAEEDRYPAERCRLQAEQIWYNANRLTLPDEEPAQTALRELRVTLEDCTKHQEEDAPSEVDEYFLLDMERPEDEEEEEEEDMRSANDEAAAPERKHGPDFITRGMEKAWEEEDEAAKQAAETEMTGSGETDVQGTVVVSDPPPDDESSREGGSIRSSAWPRV